jgi:hypothetical protein
LVVRYWLSLQFLSRVHTKSLRLSHALAAGHGG